MRIKDCPHCNTKQSVELNSYCGAWVCFECEHHSGLVRCFCGWTLSGKGDGRAQLVEMGETIEPEL